MRFRPQVLRRVGRFLGLLSVAAALLGAAFVLTYRLMGLHDGSVDGNLVNVMLRLYVATLVVASMGVWWIVLSHESQEQSERELLESMRHLEQTRKDLVESEKLASLGALVAGVAHEINTPVGIAVSTASYLGDRTQAAQAALATGAFEPAAQEKYLRDAGESARLLLSNARRAAQLVQNFKQLAVDQISEERRRFDLREHLEEAVHALRPKLGEARVDVRIDAASGIQMHSYPISLAQVVTNLVVNSLQHAFARGQAGCIAIVAMPCDDDEIQIEYSDNGGGIDPAVRARMFEPFVTTRRMLGGSGLGLYIVNQLVTRQLNGSVALDNASGRPGARFILRIPRVARSPSDVSRTLSVLPRASTDEP
jgi:signal transduction histidine kinase